MRTAAQSNRTALKPGGDEQKINSEKDTTKLQNPEVLVCLVSY
jgi:hypothetical protein